MPDPIGPALSAELWARLAKHRDHQTFAAVILEGGYDEALGANTEHAYDDPTSALRAAETDAVRRGAGVVAVLNDTLPDSDPRKITRERLDALVEVIGAAALWIEKERESGRDMKPGDNAVSLVAQLAIALESYLPPEPLT